MLMAYDTKDRVELYNKTFLKWPSMFYEKGWIIGCWNIGNNYASKNQFYGEFPRGFLKRLMSMFPDKKSILHLFSGSLEPGDYTRVDVSEQFNPDILGRAEEISQLTDKKFDLIICDPPYQKEDSEIYGCKHPNKFNVVKECFKVATDDAHLCWLDERLVMYRKSEWNRIGDILITRSTNHRFRALTIFEKAK
jgi:hypothetical protein